MSIERISAVTPLRLESDYHNRPYRGRESDWEEDDQDESGLYEDEERDPGESDREPEVFDLTFRLEPVAEQPGDSKPPAKSTPYSPVPEHVPLDLRL